MTRAPRTLLAAYNRASGRFRAAVRRGDGDARAQASAQMSGLEERIRETRYRFVPRSTPSYVARYELRRCER